MLNYLKGDLFSHKSDLPVVLAHACNPFGSWGGGIAAQFRKRYPYANRLYAQHCQHNSGLLGTCLLVPASQQAPQVYVACLFTSDFNNSPESIVQYTRQSMEDLARQLEQLPVESSGGKPVVNMPMINSGIFNVPWDDTAPVLEAHTALHVNVYTL